MLQNLEQILLEKQIRPTAMRLLVLDFLLKQKAAVSVNDVEAGFLRSDRITLYRTLRTFEEKGLVHDIKDGTGSVKYALCPQSCSHQQHADLHVHFHCRQCSETYCLPDSQIPDIDLPDFFVTEEVNLIIKGICAACRINTISLQDKEP
ncbi:Fur family transcriptional regulator [Telluribacter humicola]|uniref:Fur family transcriptional regulator n=1 Tax=Telluribacter humicola TaxID=1720261 RepID=UPI001A9654A3|nr:transcriptional repressor [Telluribacter humicola]